MSEIENKRRFEELNKELQERIADEPLTKPTVTYEHPYRVELPFDEAIKIDPEFL